MLAVIVAKILAAEGVDPRVSDRGKRHLGGMTACYRRARVRGFTFRKAPSG
jgi:hypothetical protein